MFAHLQVLADSAPPTNDGGTLAVILGLVSAALGTLFTAMSPVLLQVVKNRGKHEDDVDEPGAHPPRHADAPLSSDDRLIQEAVEDYRRQRDDAMRHYYDLLAELERTRSLVAEQSVVIARLQARLNIVEI